MPGPRARGLSARHAFAALFAVALLGGLAAAPGHEVAAQSRWSGGIDLYRRGAFTTQKTWLWCTAADVQIIKNITDRETDHTKAAQRRYFDYMRKHDRYAIPVSEGVDPAGWTAGLRHFVDRRYRLVASSSFDAALRSAVTNLRKTNLPVAITVANGRHAWVLTGFTASADPARTSRFTVTSVRVVGPLWGLQSRAYGYDMRPDRRLTPSQLKGFFTPWHYAGIKMVWAGRWVSIQPMASPAAATTARPVPTARAPRAPAPSPSAAAVASASPSVAPSTSPSMVAIAGPVASPEPGPVDRPASDTRSDLVAAVVTLAVVAGLLGAGLRRIGRPRSASAPRR